MPRKPRIEYEDAVYHVISRGDREQSIVGDNSDRRIFLDTLDEACCRTGWRLHAWVLMDNHYHLLLETPEPNLVVGMKWFQGTYTTRFNCKHRMRGHLYQGRYKAIPVDTADPEYFRIVADYIHLNPARAGMLNPQRPRLADYRWGSYPAYLKARLRPSWLYVDKVLDALHFSDTRAGLRQYARYIRERVRESLDNEISREFLAEPGKRREQWYMGGAVFRAELLEMIDRKSANVQDDSWSGSPMTSHNECRAESLIGKGLDILGLTDETLELLPKSAPEKVVLAWLVRGRTHVRNRWIADRLRMGRATNLSRHLKHVREDLPKYAKLKRKMMKI